MPNTNSGTPQLALELLFMALNVYLYESIFQNKCKTGPPLDTRRILD